MRRTMCGRKKNWGSEMLVMAVRLEQNQQFDSALREEIVARNRRLPDFKRVGGYLIWEKGFSADGVDEDQAAGAGGGIGKDAGAGSGGGAVNGRASYLAIVNPAAGGGRSRKMLGAALGAAAGGGVAVEVAETQGAGDATRIAREAYGRGQRRFIAVGGDGTSYEMVNGLFPEASAGGRPTLGFFRWGQGILFCAISATAGWSTRSSR